MPHQTAIAGEIEPRGLTCDEAARYCGISASRFLSLVADGTLPAPMPFAGKVKVWDRKAIDRVYDRVSGIGSPDQGNEWMTALHAKQNTVRPAR